MDKIVLPPGVEQIREYNASVRLGHTGNLDEIETFLKSINYEINQLLMLNTIAACHGHVSIVKWILENTPFDANPEINKPQLILDLIRKNNHVDVLKVCLENPRMLHVLKTTRFVFSIVYQDSMQENNVATLDYAAVDAVESDQIEILAALYPHISSEIHDIYPNSSPNSVKQEVLKILIQKHATNKNMTWLAMIQTILDDVSYDPSYPHDNDPIQVAIKCGNVEIVRLLLSHQRVKICEDTIDDGLMTDACMHSDSDAGIEILKMFLEDPRFMPSRDANSPIHTLAHDSHNRGLAYIMNCPRIRWDWFGRPSPLAKCVENINMEGVRILLSQRQYNPCMNNNDAYFAAKEIQSTHPEFLAELSIKPFPSK